MHKISLGHLQLTIGGLKLQHISLDENPRNLGGHVIHGDVAGRIALRRADEVRRTLVNCPHQIIAVAGLGQLVVPSGVGGGLGHFAHAALHVHQHHGVAHCRPAGGLVGHRSGDLSLGHCARQQNAQGNGAKNDLRQFHGGMGILLICAAFRLKPAANVQSRPAAAPFRSQAAPAAP